MNNVQSGVIEMDGKVSTGYGYNVLTNNTGIGNSAYGRNVLANNTGNSNTAVGDESMKNNTTGFQNTALGVNTLYSNTTGTANTAAGYLTLHYNTIGYYNTGLGFQSLYYNTNGHRNSASGFASLHNNRTGAYNTAAGAFAMYKSFSGSNNTVSGHEALYTATATYDNTATGVQALYYSTANYNTGFGSSAGSVITTGERNTFIGYQANALSGTLNNATAIGATAKVDASNAMVLGGTGGNAVNVGIGVTIPTHTLDVNGKARIRTLEASASTSVVVADANGVLGTSANVISSNAWSLAGNSGTTAGSSFIGTVDDQAIQIHAYNSHATADEGTGRVWKIVPRTGTGSSPNIIGGYQSNVVASEAVGAVISGGGMANAVNSVDTSFATISGGHSNRATGYASSIDGGHNALAVNYAQNAYSAGAFNSVGDAQTSVYVARNTTTDSLPADLYLDGSGAKMFIADNAVWKFHALVVGSTSSGSIAGAYELSGAIKNVGGAASLVGAVSQTSVTEDNDAASWDVTAVADANQPALVIQVSGSTSNTVRWVARVETTEVTFP